MSKIKIEVTCDNITSTVEIDSEVWMDSFPSYLNALRGAGYCIPEGTSIYVPGELFEKCENEFGHERDYVLTDSDLKSEEDFDDSLAEKEIGEAIGDLIREELHKYVDERELQKEVDRLSAAMNADTTWKPVFGHHPAELNLDDTVEIACRGEFYTRHARNVAWSTVAELDGRWRLIRKADAWIQVETLRNGSAEIPKLKEYDLVEVKFADGKVTTLRFGNVGVKWNLINEYRVKARA